MDPVFTLKRRSTEDTSLCIFCQVPKVTETLSKPSDYCLEKVKCALQRRKKLKPSNDVVTIDRLDAHISSNSDNKCCIVWHWSCYSHFTDNSRIDRAAKAHTPSSPSPLNNSITPKGRNSTPNLRKNVHPVNWKLCIFCQESKSKLKMRSVSTKSLSDDIMNNSHIDHNLHVRLSGEIDLIASEGKYHLTCLSSFQRKVIKSKTKSADNQDIPLNWLCDELRQSAFRGHVLELDDVWDRYEELVAESSCSIPQSFISRKTTFRSHLEQRVVDLYTFIRPLDRDVSERKTFLIPILSDGSKYSHVINLEQDNEQTQLPFLQHAEDMLQSLVHVALKIRGEIMNIEESDVMYITEQNVTAYVPDSLYLLLRIIIGGQDEIDALDNAEEEQTPLRNQTLGLSIAQDLVYAAHGGSKWTPKHVGLASSLHQATRSKHLVNLFHKAGHCLSYKQVLQLDTTLAETTLQTLDEESGAVIPPNLVENEFIHYTADNIDILDETLDGKNTFHATQMAAWQRTVEPTDANQLPIMVPSNATKTTLQVPEALEALHNVQINPAMSEPPATFGVHDTSWYDCSELEKDTSIRDARSTDMAFHLHRNTHESSGWTLFNQKITTRVQNQNSVGYLPILIAPAHEYDTLNTVVKRCFAISAHFGQEHTVITVDQALYCKLMELKWATPDYNKKLIPRLGGLHISMNFLKVIGDHMEGSGLSEAWVESGLLAPGPVQLVLNGKAYSKGLRAHKLTIQALWKLLLPRLLSFVEQADPDHYQQLTAQLSIDDPEHVMNLIESMKTDRIQQLVTDFIKEESKQINVAFWLIYIELVSILLMFTRSLRDGIWDLYLASFALMLPYFGRYDHLNYARWGPVYLAEMRQLPQAVLEEFQRGNFVVKRSDKPFNQVDPDQAQEWLNCTGKTGGGIVGITKTPSALSRWALSFNVRSDIASATYAMYKLFPSDSKLTNESSKSRQVRDEKDEISLYTTLQRFNVFSPESHPDSLQNIATKDLATESIQQSVLNVKKLATEHMNRYVEARLKAESCERIPIHAPLKKSNPLTFASLYTVKQNSKEKEREKILKADRTVIQRLLTAYEAGRDVDLRSVLQHELMPVPVSLAEMDGTLRTGNKSVLVDCLTDNVVCPEYIDLHTSANLIIDAQALVVVIGKPDGATTFGDLADTFCNTVLSLGRAYQRIDVVFDRYRQASIKGDTRSRRTKECRPIRRLVEDRNVPLPQNWGNFLALPENKSDLSGFLSTELIIQAPTGKEIVTAGGFSEELEVQSSNPDTDVKILSSSHEEADTRLVLHAVNSQADEVVVWCKDTDVLLLLVAHYPQAICRNIWQLTGTSKKRRYIPIGQVYMNLPVGSSEALLAFHAITGCDTLSYIANHTKRTTWKTFKDHWKLLADLGIGPITTEILANAEAFICRIYSVQSDSANEGRYLLFARANKPEALCPTQNALQFHIKRAHYQTMVWRKAICPIPELPSPTELGWKQEDGNLRPILMTLDPIPESCIQMVYCSCKTQCRFGRCKCKKSKLTCTRMCFCKQMGRCLNTS